MKHIVYGNGESRPTTDLIGGEWTTTWGCNAIYRDFAVDNLVSVDYNMQQEIYDSGYALNNKCYFSDWQVLPNFDPHVGMMGYKGDIYESPKLGRKDCVVQGKDSEEIEKKVQEILIYNPQLDPKDFKKKALFSVGLYITWVAENDMVKNIEFPKGWSAGNTAIHLACQQGATEVYMVGFDGSNYAQPINNIYKGSKNYLSADSRGYNTINWDNQFKLVKRDFPNVKFIKVGTELTYEELKNNIR